MTLVPGHACYKMLCEAANKPTQEICGIILQDWTVVPITNVAESDAEFYMDETELLRWMIKTNGDLLGVYHSHPNGRPHPSDVDETFTYPLYRYFIAAGSHLYEWTFTDDGPRCVDASGKALPKDVVNPIFNFAEKV